MNRRDAEEEISRDKWQEGDRECLIHSISFIPVLFSMS